jgi:hypothetical protein
MATWEKKPFIHRDVTWTKVFDYFKVKMVKSLTVTFVRETDGTTKGL